MNMSPHDGTDPSTALFKGGDIVVIKSGVVHPSPASRFHGQVCEVLNTSLHHPHHMSHGWYYWLKVPGQYSELICIETEIERAK
jgi:hypothetical protein